MEEPTPQDIIEYVAEMAQGLADFGRAVLPSVAIVLDIAAEMARDKLEVMK